MSSRPDYSEGRPSTAQPEPTPGTGESVHDVAARDCFAYGYPRVGRLLQERRSFGYRKYGRLLRPYNGRDPYLDAVEELLDALAYLSQARAEGFPRAEQFFHAVMAVTGAVVREIPEQHGRAA